MSSFVSSLLPSRPMAFFNPVYAFVIPSLFLATVPLAILAGITTTLAFSVLILRVIVVYLDIALSLLPQSFASFNRPRLTAAAAATATNGTNRLSERQPSSPNLTSHRRSLHRRRRRPSSTTSAVSGGSASSISERGASVGGLGLMPSIGPERDFEGIGGWRVGGDDVDDEVWTTVNPKLEMPERPYSSGTPHHHHHYRTPSSTGGPTTPGEGYLMMRARTRSPELKTAKTPTSPNSSRARTPTGPRIGFTGMNQNSDGYFALSAGTSPKTKRPPGHGFD